MTLANTAQTLRNALGLSADLPIHEVIEQAMVGLGIAGQGAGKSMAEKGNLCLNALDQKNLADAISASQHVAMLDEQEQQNLAEAISASQQVSMLREQTTDPRQLARAIAASKAAMPVARPASLEQMPEEQRILLAIDKSLATKAAEDATKLAAEQSAEIERRTSEAEAHVLNAALAASKAEQEAAEARRRAPPLERGPSIFRNGVGPAAQVHVHIAAPMGGGVAPMGGMVLPPGMPNAMWVAPAVDGAAPPMMASPVPMGAPPQSRMSTARVVVPEGLQGGMVMQVNCGQAGLCNVQIPEGLVPGETFEFAVAM